MSIAYVTPQRIVTGHLSRYVRRTAGFIPAAALQPDIHSWFNPQLVSAGEREPVFGEFAAGVPWNAVSAAFTLWAAGTPVTGYDSVTASLAADPTGRLLTASAIVDLSAGAEYALPAGIYYGQFVVTTSTGELVAARGPVTIIAPGSGSPPDEYQMGGGIG